MFAFMSAGNVYLVLYGAHVASAHDAQSTLTVSFKNTGLDLPGRCKYYAGFSELAFSYVRKVCISREVFDRIKPGAKVAASGSQSLLGFKAQTFRLSQANPTAETDARTGHVRGSP